MHLTIFMLLLCTAFEPHAKAEKKEKKTQVVVVTTKREEAYDARLFGGMVSPVKTQKIYPDIAGAIEQIYVEPGEKVERGANLFRVRPKGAGVDYLMHTVRSPMAGIVTNVSSKLGSYLQSDDSPMEVSSLDQLRIEFEIATIDLPFVKPGIDVFFVKPGTINEPINVPAKLKYVAKAPAGAIPTYAAAADIDCSDIKELCAANFPLGSFAKVLLKLNPREAVKVNISALHGQRDKVYILDDKDIIHGVKVTLKSYSGEVAEIATGLEGGERLITFYAGKLEDGKEAKIIESEKDLSSKK